MTKGGGDGRLAEVQVEPPIHLVILSHGLAGRPADLAYLAEQLRAQVGGSNLHILPSKCNWRKTTDGIAKGGHRLASEIREVVEAHPSLKFISMVGNSLGGCYVRFAAHLLLDENGLMAGLHPHSLITIASPHLGVRNYTWIPLPHWFTQSLAPLIFGQTGRDMFLCDDEEKPLVARMAHEPEFLAAMKAFKQRRLYANLHGDFMVCAGREQGAGLLGYLELSLMLTPTILRDRSLWALHPLHQMQGSYVNVFTQRRGKSSTSFREYLGPAGAP
jgi:hypothetical protein